MSTKTLRKRIALVAVSAMGFGLLTSVAANATAGVFVSAGIRVNGTTVVAAGGSGTSQTIKIGPSSSVVITSVAGTDGEASFTVSGGTITGTSAATDAVNGLTTSTRFIYGDTATDVTFTPNAGESLMTITSWATSSDYAAGTPKAAELAVTIKTGAVGVISPADSFASVVAAATTTDPDSNVDVAAAKTVAAGTNGRVNFVLKDANGVALSSTAVVTTTASSGCLVGSTNTASSFLSGSVSTTYGTANEVFVARATTNAPATCTLTLTVNGYPFITKTIILQGKVTKLEVIDGNAGISNAYASSTIASAEAFAYNAYDAAGNIVYSVSPTFNNTATDAFTSASVNTAASLAVGYGTGDITCTGNAKGSGSFYMSYVNNAGETIKSPTYTANCFGKAVNYKATLDKSSYVPGDIATLTITATDSKGNPTNDYVYLGGTDAAGTGTANAPAIAGSNMTAVTAPTSTDQFSGGKKTYKFVVGSTEGSYQMSVDLPKFNSTTYNQAAVTVAYAIKASSTSVTNAEVLAAIVKLIASINKQIAALQKALTKKK